MAERPSCFFFFFFCLLFVYDALLLMSSISLGHEFVFPCWVYSVPAEMNM